MSETIYISGDPAQAASWSNGVPDETLDAVLNATSGACSLTAPMTCRKWSVAGYAAAFLSNNFDITIGEGGFDSGASAITGSINLGTSTITNYGNYNGRGVTATSFQQTGATWSQRGGTDETPNEWRSANGTAGLNNFALLIFDANSVTRFPAELAYLRPSETRVLGKITTAQSVPKLRWYNGGKFVIGPQAVIDIERLILYATPLEGDVSRITSTTLLAYQYATASVGGNFNCPVRYEAANNGNLVFSSLPRFYNTMTFVSPSTGTATINTGDAEYYGDIVSESADGTSINLTGTINLSGTNDQNIDSTAVSGSVIISSQKIAGNVTVLNGDFELYADSHFGGGITFSTTYSGTFASNGYSISLKGFDASQTINGVIDLRNSIITNSGGTRLQGTNNTSLLITDASITMTGGTAQGPVVWSDVAYVSPTDYRRVWASITIAEGAYVDFQSTERMLFSPVEYHIYGNITSQREHWCYDTYVYVHEGASVDIANVFKVNLKAIYAYDLTKFEATELNLLDSNESSYLNGLNVPLNLSKTTAGNSTISFADGSSVNNSVICEASATGTFNIDFNGIKVTGNVTSTTIAESTLDLDGTIILEGELNQSVDFGVVESTVGLSAEKTLGNVTIAGGNFALADEFTIANEDTPNGSLILTGTASLSSGEYAVTVADFDSSQTTGEVTIGNLTVSGDVDASASTTIDSVTLVGGENQEIDLVSVTNVPELIFDKTDSGKSNIYLSDSGNIDDLKLTAKGTGSDAYFAGTGTVQLSDDLKLKLFTKDETILFDKNSHRLDHVILTSIFPDHFYSATKNVYSLGTNFYGSTNPQVIQNAENV